MATDRLRAWLCVVCLAVLAGPVAAQQGSDDLRDRVQLVASERLRTFALARGLGAGSDGIGVARDLRALLTRQGFYLDRPGLDLILADQRFSPRLAHVPNLNGGAENRTLDLGGGFVLELREDRLARSGVALGLGYDAQARVAWMPGRFVEGRAQAGVLHAPAPDLTQTSLHLSVCSRNHLSGWSFADLCLRETRVERALQDSTLREVELGFANLFETPGRTHELTLSAGRGFGDGPARSFVTLGLDSAGLRLATRLGLRLGAPVGTETGPTTELRGELRWRVQDRVAGLGLSVFRSSSSLFLGQVRRDTGVSLNGLYEMRPNTNLTVALTRRESTVDFFDSSSVQVGLTFDLP